MARAIRASASSALIVHSEKGFDSRTLDEGRMAHPPFRMPLPCEANYGRLKIVPSSRVPVSLTTSKLPRYRSAAFSEDGKGRPSCHARPSYLDAWLSCAGSGELAPEVGIFNHNAFGRGWFHRHAPSSRVRCNNSRPWLRSKNGNGNSRMAVTI